MDEIKHHSSSPEGVTTPAAGGANNRSSRASDSPVGAATTSSEGAAVEESQAAGSPAEAVASPTADPADSNESLCVKLDSDGGLYLEYEGWVLTLPRNAVRQLGFFLAVTEAVCN